MQGARIVRVTVIVFVASLLEPESHFSQASDGAVIEQPASTSDRIAILLLYICTINKRR